MKLKKGVKCGQFARAVMITVANDVYKDYGKELVITSMAEGRHSYGSIHFSENAIDTRTRYFDDFTKLAVADDIRTRLGDDFDVVVENNHLHIEYQPKRR